MAVSSGIIAAVSTDNLFHTYHFTYDNTLGKATVQVDGLAVYSFTGVAGRSMYWAGAGNVVIGRLMDGSGSNVPVLDKMIISVPGTILPLTLLSFEGNLNNGEVFLSWATSKEVNTSYFDVEKSAGPQPFIPFQEIPAGDNNYTVLHYFATDPSPFSPDSYYRLKMVDLDGRFNYSPVVHISSQPQDEVMIYPNPASSFVWLKTTSAKSKIYQIGIISMEGKKLGVQSVNLDAGSHETYITLPCKSRQLLFIVLTDESGYRQTLKILQ